MKKTYWAILAMILLGFVSVGLFFSLAPDLIPVHYDASGQVDRWGSKYEYLIMPAMSLVFAIFMVWLARREGKQGQEMNEKVVLGMTAWVLLLFNLLWLFFMWKAIDIAQTGNGLGELPAKGLLILLFAAFIPLGNRLPKAQRNRVFGVRTKWSTANDRCWQKSQRMGGYVLVICGILGVILCALLPAAWCIWAALALSIGVSIACTVGSYCIYRREERSTAG